MVKVEWSDPRYNQSQESKLPEFGKEVHQITEQALDAMQAHYGFDGIVIVGHKGQQVQVFAHVTEADMLESIHALHLSLENHRQDVREAAAHPVVMFADEGGEA